MLVYEMWPQVQGMCSSVQMCAFTPICTVYIPDYLLYTYLPTYTHTYILTHRQTHRHTTLNQHKSLYFFHLRGSYQWKCKLKLKFDTWHLRACLRTPTSFSSALVNTWIVPRVLCSDSFLEVPTDTVLPPFNLIFYISLLHFYTYVPWKHSGVKEGSTST